MPALPSNPPNVALKSATARSSTHSLACKVVFLCMPVVQNGACLLSGRGARGPRRVVAVRRGGLWLAVYSNSLGGVLLLLFAVSFAAHAFGRPWSTTRRSAGTVARPYRLPDTLPQAASGSSRAALSIWLRQRGSAQSKPVDALAPPRSGAETDDLQLAC